MAFVKAGKRKAFKHTFTIRPKGGTPQARRKELAAFRAALKQLARKHGGSVK